MMFERFTERARKVMALANQNALRFKHEHIDTEHILLGLLKEGTGVGANVLKNLGVDLNKAREEVERRIEAGPKMVADGKLPQTPRAKKALDYAVEEARSFSHNYIGTEHLTLGLLRETDGVAARIMTDLGLKIDEVRQEALELLGAGMDVEVDDIPLAAPADEAAASDALAAILSKFVSPGGALVASLDLIDGKLRARYRTDGADIDGDAPLPRPLGQAVVDRLKKLLNLPVTTIELPQEGRLTEFEGHAVNLHVTFVPSEGREVIIIRAPED